jgi:hypothetical protein
MASGKSCSTINPDGIRRTVNGKTLAPRSKRKTERVVNSVLRWLKVNDKWEQQPAYIESFVSKLFLE